MGSSDDTTGLWSTGVRLFDGCPEVQLAVDRRSPADDEIAQSVDPDPNARWLEFWPADAQRRPLLARRTDDPGALLAVAVARDDAPAIPESPSESPPEPTRWPDAKDRGVLTPIAATAAGQEMVATTYCARTGRFFHPFCPESISALRTCRNDELLGGWGLEPFSTSTVRYSVGIGAIAGQPRSVYTSSESGGDGAVEGLAVRRRNELYRDYAGLWQRGIAGDQAEFLAREFPCWQCEHRTECYGPPAEDGRIEAENHLVTVNYHDAEVRVFVGFELSFDALTALLGGTRASNVADRVLPWPALDEHRGATLRALDADRQWLTPGAGGAAMTAPIAAQFANEVASVKLRQFAQLCETLAAERQRLDRSDVGLLPERVRARFSPGGTGLVPARWTADVRLLPAPADSSAGDLGLVLARLLWQNDTCDSAAVATLTSAIAATPADSPDDVLDAILRDRAECGSAAVLHEREHRDAAGAAPIPPVLWRDALRLVLRLLAPGGDADLTAVGAAAIELAGRLEVEAFGNRARRTELHAVLLAELRALERSSGA